MKKNKGASKSIRKKKRRLAKGTAKVMAKYQSKLREQERLAKQGKKPQEPPKTGVTKVPLSHAIQGHIKLMSHRPIPLPDQH